MLQVNKIREDFPIFKIYQDLIYLDNAATTHKPIQVIEAIKEFYSQFNANVRRGIYKLSIESTKLYEEAHERVAKFIGANAWYEVIFTRNTTEAINIIAYSLMDQLNPGDEIIITVMEHHSNMLPWLRLAKLKNLKIKVVEVTEEGILRYDQVSELINKRTKVVAFTHVSNVLGIINDVKKIVKTVRESSNAFIVLDGAQSVPHIPINVRDLDIDFLTFSGHKMLGPQGIGVLWGREDLLRSLEPSICGGGAIENVEVYIEKGSIVHTNIEYADLPWKFEAGTPDVASGIGLAKAVEYIESLGIGNIYEHEKELAAYTLKRLQEELGDRVVVMGSKDVRLRGGIISFIVQGLDPHVVATLLSMNNIAVRAGFHCAQPLHIYLGFKKGSVRVSFYVYNDLNDVDVFVEELKKIVMLSTR